MKATNIKWDTDGDKMLLRTLPDIVILPEQFSHDNYMEDGEYDEDALFEDVADWLSDEYGFCHFGFDIED